MFISFARLRRLNLAVVAAVTFAVTMLCDRSLIGQSADRRRASGSLSRTVDGQPDLEGIWFYLTLTPMDRPTQFEGKPFLTDQEAADYEKKRREEIDFDRKASTAEADLQSASINDFWTQRGPLARVNGRIVSSLVIDPPDGRRPAVTAAGQARLARRAQNDRVAAGPQDFSASERCLHYGRPPIFPGIAGEFGLIEIVQARDHVAIRQEAWHETRIVPLDGRPHLAGSIRQWLGDARGRWSGETLIVDSTNFVDSLDLYDQSLHLIERFTRIDTDTLLYQFTADDPTFYAKPWTVVLPMRRSRQPLLKPPAMKGITRFLTC
jgi:hypothetical protein